MPVGMQNACVVGSKGAEDAGGIVFCMTQSISGVCGVLTWFGGEAVATGDRGISMT